MRKIKKRIILKDEGLNCRVNGDIKIKKYGYTSLISYFLDVSLEVLNLAWEQNLEGFFIDILLISAKKIIVILSTIHAIGLILVCFFGKNDTVCFLKKESDPLFPPSPEKQLYVILVNILNGESVSHSVNFHWIIIYNQTSKAFKLDWNYIVLLKTKNISLLFVFILFVS